MSRSVRQWRHLKQIKRGGGCHTVAGLASIPDGSFALECPACPHPGRNLPQNWDQVSEDKRYVFLLLSCAQQLRYFPSWLYSCFLAVDGNFRLKLKSCGINDPEIGSGWSYFVESKEYINHISKNTTDIEVCPNSSIVITILIFFCVRLLDVVPLFMLSIK